MGTPASLRASDAERDAAAGLVRDHYADGRLDVDELRQRLDLVYAARTHGELDRALVDLPRAPVSGGAGLLGSVRARAAERRRQRWRRGWIRFAWVNAACWSLWVLVVLGTPNHDVMYFWPVVLTVPWTIRRLALRPDRPGPAPLPRP
jgi:hypothetical protein